LRTWTETVSIFTVTEQAPPTAKEIRLVEPPPPTGPDSGRVEPLLEQIAELTPAPRGSQSFEMWVPGTLTLGGQPIADDLAMAILLDALLAKEFFPDGYQQGAGGRLYRYGRRAA
jgi:hypothetical protein